MPHRAKPQKNISMKTKLLLIAAMFVIINLIFYVGFDSSDEPLIPIEFDDTNQIDITDSLTVEQESNIVIDP